MIKFGFEGTHTYRYEEFLKEFEKDSESKRKGNQIICCPEPIYFYKKFLNSSPEESENILKELLKEKKSRDKDYEAMPEFQRISTSTLDETKWMQTTKKEVRFYPGKKDVNVRDYISLGNNDCVHGVIVGRTGSGKSVFINHLLMMLMHEYAPWELDLYLVDLKKVELGRYMSEVDTPHIVACAITEEIRYVVSMLEYVYRCMQIRQKLFEKVGVKDLPGFRKKLSTIADNESEVVLPRVVVVVDEFQQIYKESEGTSEEKRIRFLINSIIRLGRATGFHLLFASQDMQNALSRNEMANFKARFALPCDSAVSQDIVGSSVASDSGKPYGVVYVNREGGKTGSNSEQYEVPFIDSKKAETGEDFFLNTLTKMKEDSEKCNFIKPHSFYDEDKQEEIKELERILSNEKVKEKIKKERENNKDCYDIIVLGRGVVYSEKKNNLETFYIEKGVNKNILSVCSRTIDLQYTQKLLALNFRAFKEGAEHKYFSFCPHIKYDIKADLKNVKELKDFEEIKKEYEKRNEERIQNKEKKWDSWYVWISGLEYIDNISKITKGLSDVMEHGLEVNILFLLFAQSANPDYVTPEIKKRCNYLFVKDVLDDTYDKLKMSVAMRSKNDIVIDLKINSFNEERSFKKYSISGWEEEGRAPELDFDELLK